jgi:hypothetical protein
MIRWFLMALIRWCGGLQMRESATMIVVRPIYHENNDASPIGVFQRPQSVEPIYHENNNASPIGVIDHKVWNPSTMKTTTHPRLV